MFLQDPAEELLRPSQLLGYIDPAVYLLSTEDVGTLLNFLEEQTAYLQLHESDDSS
jgi:hypothetical protein